MTAEKASEMLAELARSKITHESQASNHASWEAARVQIEKVALWKGRHKSYKAVAKGSKMPYIPIPGGEGRRSMTPNSGD